MISIVIRNKNEAISLENNLFILNKIYKSEFEEIIIVDNNSTDNSLEIAKKYDCKIITMDNFTYGKATNLGIENSSQNVVLLLSSHAVPVGASFFKNALLALNSDKKIAGIRFINSIENYKRAIDNNFNVNEPLKFGLKTACAIVNKKVWEKYKFDENLVFSEDKHWSNLVTKNGYEIIDLNETFFYEVKRTAKSELNRYKNETLAYYQLSKEKFPASSKIIFSFLKKIMITNQINYLKNLKRDILVLKIKLHLNQYLKSTNKNLK
jgi:glycosyltransferase involved in cell wall biosynthesis